MKPLTGLVVQAGGVQGGDQLPQTLLGPVHLPVSSHEEAPGRHGSAEGEARGGGPDEEAEDAVDQLRRLRQDEEPAVVCMSGAVGNFNITHTHSESISLLLDWVYNESNGMNDHQRPLLER